MDLDYVAAVPAPPHVLKRSRSASDYRLSNKKRAPAAQLALPAHLARDLSHQSGASSDWSALDGLQLATPPTGSPSHGYTYGTNGQPLRSASYGAMDMDDDSRQYSPFDSSTHLAPEHAHSLPASPRPRAISPFGTYSQLAALPPHYPPHLASNLAGSPPPFDSPRFITRSGLYGDGSLSPEQQMRMTPPPEATYGRNASMYSMETALPHDHAIPNSPRARPGYKITMGYRADCDKCIRSVPGHYQHLEPLHPDLNGMNL